MKTLFSKTATLTFLFYFTICTAIKAQHVYVLALDNPFSIVSLSHFASPALGDIDADGDLDLFVGQYNSNMMLFYRNMGSAQEPVFEEQTGADNPLDIYTSNSGCNAPALVDIDADGDLDVFVGIYTYIIRHLRNEGNATDPSYVFQTGGNNPLDLVMTEGICSFPAFVDIDHDSDLDVFITDGDGNIDFYKNTGDPMSPVFELDSIENPLGYVVLTARAKIAFEDISGDGLKDAVISHDADEPELLYFQNTGTAENAVFEERTGSANPFDGITGSEALVPAFADIDDDGDRDLVLGTWQGVQLYKAENTSHTSDIALGSAFNIYPNPASEAFTVHGNGIRDIVVIDQQGRLVKHLETSGNTTTVYMDNKDVGIFFVRLITTSGISTRKVVLH